MIGAKFSNIKKERLKTNIMSSETEQCPVIVEQRTTATTYRCIDMAECPDCGEMAVQHCGRCATCHLCGWSICSR